MDESSERLEDGDKRSGVDVGGVDEGDIVATAANMQGIWTET